MDGNDAGHVSVLVDEAVRAVAVDRHGRYVDATFGRGGHARRLLAAMSSRARLLVIDRDAEAISCAERLACRDHRVRVRHGRFGVLDKYLDDEEHGRQSGVLFDVGVSSPQLDDAGRGFSFSAAGPLDMRMDRRHSPTAADWLNHAQEQEIATVIRRYGEERRAQAVARRIVVARPLATTAELAAAVARAIPSQDADKHVATRVFQAVRIHVNDELAELDRGLDAAFDALEVGGRLAAITFHGLEHGLVRRRFRRWVEGPMPLRRLPVRGPPKPSARRLESVGKGVRPSAAEVDANPRARSALLQAVEKIAARTTSDSREDRP